MGDTDVQVERDVGILLALYAENCSYVQSHQSMRMQTAGLIAPVILAGWIAVVYDLKLGGPIDGAVLGAIGLLSLITFFVMGHHHRKVAELDRFQVGVLNALAGVAGSDTHSILMKMAKRTHSSSSSRPVVSFFQGLSRGYVWAWFATFFFLSAIINASLSAWFLVRPEHLIPLSGST